MSSVLTLGGLYPILVMSKKAVNPTTTILGMKYKFLKKYQLLFKLKI